MARKIFLIFGYGIPKNILKDENYNLYLKGVFNRIYTLTAQAKTEKVEKNLIICCGGETDMYKPYTRNEAGEMLKFFRQFIQQRPYLKVVTKNWQFIPEYKSLSTLENLIESKGIINKRKIKAGALYIFCEQTREARIEIMAKKIFAKNYPLKVVPIDFDVSLNRYLAPSFLAQKEQAELVHSLWALKRPENLKQHHEFFKEKIVYLRKAGTKAHPEAVKHWWEEKLKNLTHEKPRN